MFRMTYFSVLVLFVFSFGCYSGGGLIVGEITGPESIKTNEMVQFRIEARNGTGLKYEWAVDPPEAGCFMAAPPVEASGSTFGGTPYLVPNVGWIWFSATNEPVEPIKIHVSVSSNEYAPVLKELEARIVAHTEIHMGYIVGPPTVRANSMVPYHVRDFYGDTGITYEWSVTPDSIGTIPFPGSPVVDFQSFNVQEDTEATLQVVVSSDNFPSETLTLDLTVEPYYGDIAEIDFPQPFGGYGLGEVLDIATEGDGDVVYATQNGLLLYTPSGIFKRVMSTDVFAGLATSNFGILDTGHGLVGLSPESECRPEAAYDDQYVEGGVNYVTYDPAWWQGEPDPYNQGVPINTASTSAFSSCDCIPHPISYHPETGYAYQKVFAFDCIADADVPWPTTNMVPVSGNGAAILAYNKDAPLAPDFTAQVFVGGQDFIVYYDYATFFEMQTLASDMGVAPACVDHSGSIIWDITGPDYMSTNPNVMAENIGDFEFDLQNRLIMVLPEANAVAITKHVLFGGPIIVDQFIGRTDGAAGTNPAEFDNPKAVATDYLTGDIYISDSGNGRIQVFHQSGEFVRIIAGGDPNFMPGAIRIDTMGNVHVANISPTRVEGDNLRIYDKAGAPSMYGRIEGHVYDLYTREPIDGAMIFFPDSASTMETICGSDGYYVFPSINSGTHTVKVEKFGYLPAEYEITLGPNLEYTLDVYIQKAMVPPPGYGMVTGTIMSSIIMLPLQGLLVEIDGEAVSGYTNDEGEFVLYNVLEGDQVLKVSKQGVVQYETPITVEKGQVLDVGVIYLPIT